MSRRTVVTSLVAGILLGGLAAPALADPILPPIGNGGDTTICLLTESGSGAREGICVWLPFGR